MEAFKAAANHFLQEVEEKQPNLSDDEEEHRGKNVFFHKTLTSLASICNKSKPQTFQELYDEVGTNFPDTSPMVVDDDDL